MRDTTKSPGSEDRHLSIGETGPELIVPSAWASADATETWIAIDHPDQLLAQPATMGQVFVRVDPSHELPIVVAVQVGKQLQIRARFALPGDCSMTFSRDPKTLPAAIVRQLAGQ